MPELPGQLGVGGEGFNCLDGEIRIVHQVPGEIVRAKLIFGVESLRQKIGGPLR